MTGRNIFSRIPESSKSPENGSSTVSPDTTSKNNTHGTGFEISWLGTFDPAQTGVWIDSGLLLVFGGIPWQVGI